MTGESAHDYSVTAAGDARRVRAVGVTDTESDDAGINGLIGVPVARAAAVAGRGREEDGWDVLKGDVDDSDSDPAQDAAIWTQTPQLIGRKRRVVQLRGCGWGEKGKCGAG
jgi:hypothetical protein